MKNIYLATLLSLYSLAGTFAADGPPTMSAAEVAGKLSAARSDGSAEIRLRMLVQKPAGQTTETLQLRIKEQRATSGSKVVYEVLFPADRKGEAAFLRQSSGQAPSGSLRKPDGKVVPLAANDLLFGSDLAVADATEDFFSWKNQSFAGSEKIGSVDCTILESKPSGSSIYGRVRSWIDLRRMVPLRIEKYLPSGALARRITTTRVVPNAGRQIPGDLKIESPDRNSQTLLDGSSIRHDVKFSPDELNAP